MFIVFNTLKLIRARSAQNFLTFFVFFVIRFCGFARFLLCLCLYIF